MAISQNSRTSEPSPYTYHSGVTMTRSCERVYRHENGLVGKVRRTRGSQMTGEWSEGVVSYFVWGAPDSAPEYDNEAAAMAAALARVSGDRRYVHPEDTQ